jgi:hypothetical protein
VTPSRWLTLVATFAALAVPTMARAQTDPPPSTLTAKQREITFGGLLAAPASLGTRSAELTRPNGTPFELFRTENRAGVRFGAEVLLTFPLSRRFAVEGAGSWSRGDIESQIENDFEGADLVLVSTSLTRFTVEGGAVVALTQRPRWVWFARGSAGWMRELTGDNVIAENGVIGNAGTGVKYWWQEPAAGRRGMGLRVEVRANVRSKGVILGEDKPRIAAVVFGGFVVGW